MQTWNVLRDLGFQLDDRVISDAKPGISYDFGNFKLNATSCLGRKFTNVVLFTAALRTSRKQAYVEFEMPTEIESREKCAAWIICHLDRHSRPELFVPDKPIPWLDTGRQNSNLLPWEQPRLSWEELERIEQEQSRLSRKWHDKTYARRPHCQAAKAWLRLALDSIAEYLVDVENAELVTITCRNGVLQFGVGAERVALAVKGDSWRLAYAIPAGEIRKLPKCLTSDPVTVGIWHGVLEIDEDRFAGARTIHIPE